MRGSSEIVPSGDVFLAVPQDMKKQFPGQNEKIDTLLSKLPQAFTAPENVADDTADAKSEKETVIWDDWSTEKAMAQKSYPTNPKNIQPNSLLEGQKDAKRQKALILLVGHEFKEPKPNPHSDLDDQRSQCLSDSSVKARREDAQRGTILCLSEAVLLIRLGSERTSYWSWMKLYENWIMYT